MTTAPGSLPAATSFLSAVVMRPRRSTDMPACSAGAVAKGWSSCAETGGAAVVASIAASAAVASIFHLPMTLLPGPFCESQLIRRRRFGTCFGMKMIALELRGVEMYRGPPRAAKMAAYVLGSAGIGVNCGEARRAVRFVQGQPNAGHEP